MSVRQMNRHQAVEITVLVFLNKMCGTVTESRHKAPSFSHGEFQKIRFDHKQIIMVTLHANQPD